MVHNFSVSPDEIALDHTIGMRLQELLGGETDTKERMRLAQEISGIVTEHLVQDLRAQGFIAMTASSGSSAAGRTLEIEGQFFTIDQGSQRRRMIIGFGAGASEVRVLVQVYEKTQAGRQLVEDFYATAKSSMRPGMGPMAGSGAIMGHAAVSAATSGGLSLVGSSSQTVEADARHLADRISDELHQFFARRGWVAPKK
jgi:ribosomal protein S19E (S16A)